MEKTTGNRLSQWFYAADKKILILVGAIAGCSLAFGALNPKFLSLDNLTNLLAQASVMGILAVGLAFVVLTGGLDLSAGYNVSLSALLGAFAFTVSQSPLASLLTSMAVGLLCGTVNGLLIAKLKIVPFIVTLATMSIFQGASNMMGEGRVMMVSHPVYTYVGKMSLGVVPISFLVTLLVFLAGALVLNCTTHGTYISALGSDEKNARSAGIPLDRYKVYAYAIVGLCAGTASFVLIGRISLVTPNSAGNSLLMDSFAAVIIGGAKSTGGSVKMSGVFLGVVLLTIITNAMTMLRIPGVAHQMFKGIVIIFALVMNTYGGQIKKRIRRKPDGARPAQAH